MRKNNCKLIRRELDELMLGAEWSAAATEHLRECASCREFQVQQTKLRQIVGSLGTVEAPADFDFRLRARLANDAGSAPTFFWTFVRRGLAVAAMVIVIVTGVVVVRDVFRQMENNKVEVAQKPEVRQPVKPDEAAPVVPEEKKTDHVVAGVTPATIRKIRPTQADYRKQPLATKDVSSVGASVLNRTEPAGVSASFPIDASAQSFTVSLEDGRGNAKTISVPTVSFGSQRIVQSGNPFAPKRDW
ncbi:MAG TPA: hypothetical protein VKB05_13875 [Pyrinomonadaceae bacterium]|nr:hypothetical protein [Pyrinomonadaceae bacterium]